MALLALKASACDGTRRQQMSRLLKMAASEAISTALGSDWTIANAS
jgi:hypothetical protein